MGEGQPKKGRVTHRLVIGSLVGLVLGEAGVCALQESRDHSVTNEKPAAIQIAVRG
jgi:hypothetical protein